MSKKEMSKSSTTDTVVEFNNEWNDDEWDNTPSTVPVNDNASDDEWDDLPPEPESNVNVLDILPEEDDAENDDIDEDEEDDDLNEEDDGEEDDGEENEFLSDEDLDEDEDEEDLDEDEDEEDLDDDTHMEPQPGPSAIDQAISSQVDMETSALYREQQRAEAVASLRDRAATISHRVDSAGLLHPLVVLEAPVAPANGAPSRVMAVFGTTVLNRHGFMVAVLNSRGFFDPLVITSDDKVIRKVSSVFDVLESDIDVVWSPSDDAMHLGINIPDCDGLTIVSDIISETPPSIREDVPADMAMSADNEALADSIVRKIRDTISKYNSLKGLTWVLPQHLAVDTMQEIIDILDIE